MNAPAPGKAQAFAELMQTRGLGAPPEGEVTISGSDPFWRTPVRAGETAAAVLGAIGVASNDIWEARTGRRQEVSVTCATPRPRCGGWITRKGSARMAPGRRSISRNP